MDIKIVVCDDEVEICALLEMMLIDIFRDKGMSCEVESFYTGESLCKEFERRKYDLIFLDIEMDGKSGIDVGRFLRDELGNETVQIVYISAKTEYAMELFEFHPMNFLVKPIERSKIEKLVNKYLIITEQNNKFFGYKKKTDYFKVPLSDILYFESHNRKIHIQMKDREDDFYGSMDDVYKMVKGHCYLFIHKSIIVNYRQIKKIFYEKVVMIDNTVLPISQSRRSAIRKMCMKIRKEEK